MADNDRGFVTWGLNWIILKAKENPYCTQLYDYVDHDAHNTIHFQKHCYSFKDAIVELDNGKVILLLVVFVVVDLVTVPWSPSFHLPTFPFLVDIIVDINFDIIVDSIADCNFDYKYIFGD